MEWMFCFVVTEQDEWPALPSAAPSCIGLGLAKGIITLCEPLGVCRQCLIHL